MCLDSLLLEFPPYKKKSKIKIIKSFLLSFSRVHNFPIPGHCLSFIMIGLFATNKFINQCLGSKVYSYCFNLEIVNRILQINPMRSYNFINLNYVTSSTILIPSLKIYLNKSLPSSHEYPPQIVRNDNFLIYYIKSVISKNTLNYNSRIIKDNSDLLNYDDNNVMKYAISLQPSLLTRASHEIKNSRKFFLYLSKSKYASHKHFKLSPFRGDSVIAHNFSIRDYRSFEYCECEFNMREIENIVHLSDPRILLCIFDKISTPKERLKLFKHCKDIIKIRCMDKSYKSTQLFNYIAHFGHLIWSEENQRKILQSMIRNEVGIIGSNNDNFGHFLIEHYSENAEGATKNLATFILEKSIEACGKLIVTLLNQSRFCRKNKRFARKMLLHAITRHPNVIFDLPARYINRDLVKIASSYDGHILTHDRFESYLRNSLKNYNMIKDALKSRPSIFQHLPERLRSIKIFVLIAIEDPKMIRYVGPKKIDKFLMDCFKKNPQIVRYKHNVFLEEYPDIFEEAILNDQDLLYWALRTPKLTYSFQRKILNKSMEKLTIRFSSYIYRCKIKIILRILKYCDVGFVKSYYRGLMYTYSRSSSSEKYKIMKVCLRRNPKIFDILSCREQNDPKILKYSRKFQL